MDYQILSPIIKFDNEGKLFMETILAIFGAIMVVVVFYGTPSIIGKLMESSIEKKLQEQVRWCTTENSRYYRDGFRLTEYIYNYSIKLNIDEKYRLAKDDEPMITKTLEKYSENLGKSYLDGLLIKDKHIASFSCEEYFFFSLTSFLRENECSLKFLGNNMYTISNKKEYGGFSYTATYELNEFSILYHKLYLLTVLYCEASENIQKHCYLGLSDSIKKTIDTKQMLVSNCR